MELRLQQNRKGGPFSANHQRDEPLPDTPESDLHDKTEEWCLAHSLYYVHSRMDKPTTNAKGTPDFIIAFPRGKTLWLELKRRNQKPRPDQIQASAHLCKSGHISVITDNWNVALGALMECWRISSEQI